MGNQRIGIGKSLAKPLLTANVFSKFSQWKPEATEKYQPYKTTEVEATQPKRRRLETKSHCQDEDNVTNSQQMMKTFQELSVTPGSSKQQQEETSPKVESVDEKSYEWKMNRFVKDCHQQQKVLHKEQQVLQLHQQMPFNSGRGQRVCSSSFASMSEKSCLSAPTKKHIGCKTPAITSVASTPVQQQTTRTTLQSGQKTEQGEEKVKLPKNFCINFINQVFEDVAKNVIKLPDHGKEIKARLLKQMKSTESGRAVLKSVLAPIPSETATNLAGCNFSSDPPQRLGKIHLRTCIAFIFQ